MARFKEKAEAAKALEELLKVEGRHRDAQIIMRLRKSGSSAWTTLRQIHRDNVELRRRLDLPTFAEASAQKDSE